MPMNEIITNLSGDHVTHEEETILRFGVLKYDLATRPNESQIITTAASLWRQLKRENLIPDSFIKLHKFKTSIKALAKYLIPEVAKYLTKHLNPITTNEFSKKDSFDAVAQINDIPQNIFNDEFKFVSFDVKSLFTNIPLKKTVNIILHWIYNKKGLATSLRKRTPKKLLLDSCTKTPFFDQWRTLSIIRRSHNVLTT